MKSTAYILGLLFLAPLLPAQAEDWADVQSVVRQAGVEDQRLSSLIDLARKAQYTPEQLLNILQSVITARQQHLAVQPLMDKIEEGLAKRAPAPALSQACEYRYRQLVSASRLAAETQQTDSQVMESSLQALESGVSEETIRQVLTAGKGKGKAQVQSAIEAAETLHLNGLDASSVQSLATDCLQRNLRRSEILRTVRYSCQQHRAGMSGNAIRQSLWGQGAAGGSGQKSQQRNGSGEGADAGGARSGIHTPGTGGGNDRTHSSGNSPGGGGAGGPP